jgi:hypothetical protein
MRTTLTRLAEHLADESAEAGMLAASATNTDAIEFARAVLHLAAAQRRVNRAVDALRQALANEPSAAEIGCQRAANAFQGASHE